MSEDDDARSCALESLSILLQRVSQQHHCQRRSPRTRTMPRLISRSLVASCSSATPARLQQALHTSATTHKQKRQKPFKVPVDYSRYNSDKALRSAEESAPRRSIRPWEEDERGGTRARRERDEPHSAASSFGVGQSWLGRSRESEALEQRATKLEPEPRPRKTGWLDGPVRNIGDERIPVQSAARQPLVPPKPTPPQIDYGEFKPAYTDPSLVRFAKSSAGKDSTSGPWMPTKKLTQSAMAGLKALHQADPEKFSRAELSEKFGISYESVKRITRSKFRDVDEGDGMEASGSKWDLRPESAAGLSPVPALRRAFESAGIEIGRKERTGFGFKPRGEPRDSQPNDRRRLESFELSEGSVARADPRSSSRGPRDFGAKSTDSVDDDDSHHPGDYRPRVIVPKTMDEVRKIVPQAPTAAQAALSPFNGPRGLRSAIKHMLRSDAKRSLEMEDIVKELTPRERRLAEEIDMEREAALLANKKGMKRRKAKSLKLATEGLL